METKAIIALILMVLGIAAVNAVMFGVVRGLARGDNRWMGALRDGLNKPLARSERPYDELRQKMRELSDEKKED
jgi:hypothetical protein